MLNPRRLRWRGSTHRVDGTPITNPLDYELGELVGEAFVPKLIVVGELQESGEYIAQLADMGFEDGNHTVALRAIELGPNLASAWSQPVSFTFIRSAPAAPFGLAVE